MRTPHRGFAYEYTMEVFAPCAYKIEVTEAKTIRVAFFIGTISKFSKLERLSGSSLVPAKETGHCDSSIDICRGARNQRWEVRSGARLHVYNLPQYPPW